MTLPPRPYCNLTLDDDPRLLRHACLSTLAEAEAENTHRRAVLLSNAEALLGTQQPDVAAKLMQVSKGLASGRGCSAVADFELRDRLWGLAHDGGVFDAIAVPITRTTWRYPLSALPAVPPSYSDLFDEVLDYLPAGEFQHLLLGAVFDSSSDTIALSRTAIAYGEVANDIRDIHRLVAPWHNDGGFAARGYDGDQAAKALASYALCRPLQPAPSAVTPDSLVAELTVLAWLSQWRHEQFAGW